jgi:hypothetical protein
MEAGSTEDPPSFATLAAWSIAFVRRSCPEERFGEAGGVARGVVAVALDEAEACVLMYFGTPRCVDIFVPVIETFQKLNRRAPHRGSRDTKALTGCL